MGEKLFKMPLKRQQERFSIAFVQAISSVAGYGIEEVNIDIDSIDLTIRQYVYDGIYPVCDSLRCQIKSTYAHKPKNNIISYPLPIKNYNDLRQPNLIPRILIVVYTPKDTENWLYNGKGCLSLYHAAYWFNIYGMPPSENTGNVTIHIPTKQQFTVNELQRMMSILAKDGKL